MKYMWRKLLIVLLTSIGAVSIAYGYYNWNMNAQVRASTYYGVGEVFEETGTITFRMGGWDWTIVYEDDSTGEGYIMGRSGKYGAAMYNQVNEDLDRIRQEYDLSDSDVIGERVKSHNNVSTLNLMTLEEYDIITDHEKKLELLLGRDFWLEAFFEDNPEHRIYHYGTSNAVPGYNYLRYNTGTNPRLGSCLYPVFKIKLPSKLKKIQAVTSDKKEQIKKYGESIDPFQIRVVDGVGPFHFYLYDVDENGVGDDTIPSAYFTLENLDSTKGTAQVKQIQNLPSGDHYFKVKVIDECPDENLYNDPSDFTKDESRMKESDAIHVEIQRGDLNIAFQQSGETRKSIVEATSGWDEPAIVHPNDDVEIQYSIVGGDIGLIDIDENTGRITYKGNGAFGKVKIRATADDNPASGEDKYNSAFTEKDIVIYREVDGVVTPDPASSDINVPTFSVDQANIKMNGTIGTIKGTLGTPDTTGGSTTTYKYEIKSGGNANFFKVNSSTGVMQANANLAVGTYNFTITVSDKWSSKDIQVQVNVGMAPAENLKFYENSTSNTIINKKSAKVTDTGVMVFATVKGSSNNNPVTYRLKDGESTNVLDVNPNSGLVTLKNVGTVVIIAEKQGSSGQADAIAELEFTVTAGSQQFIYTDAGGNELPKNGTSYKDYEEVYGKGKTFQLYTSNGINSKAKASNTVTYTLQAGSPTDVISVDQNGLVTILNASLNTQIGQVIVEATSHDPGGNYTDKTIELPITITKADQTISFKNVTPAQSGQGKVTPIILAQDISSNEGGVSVSDTDYYISVDASANGVAWTNNGIDIEYNYSGDPTIEIPLHVEKAGNRNYNKTEANGKMRILSPDESNLSINQPGKIYYGDHFTIRSLQDDSSSTNVQYKFEVNNTIYISQPNVNGNKAEFDALKNSGNTEIEIKVTRTADGEVALSKTIKIKVLPKDIEIIIDDKQKKQGEENPELTFQDFQDQLVSWNGVKDQVDSDDVKLSTTATTTSKGGSYPITGNPKTMNGKFPNYNFIFKDGKLMVEGMIDKDVDGDEEPDFNDPDGDGCPDVNIKWQDEDGNWIIINGDRDYDGIPDLNIDSDGDGKPDINIDMDGDEIPDIDIDINGNGKPDINIDTDDDGKADENLYEINEWKPDKDSHKNGFLYDTIEIKQKKRIGRQWNHSRKYRRYIIFTKLRIKSRRCN